MISDSKKKEKSVYGNLFNKISVYDDKAAVTITTSNGGVTVWPDVDSNPKVNYSVFIY